MPKIQAIVRRKVERPSASEFGQLRAHLARSGVAQSTIKSVLGDTVGGRDRATIVEVLRKWLRDRPPAKVRRINDKTTRS